MATESLEERILPSATTAAPLTAQTVLQQVADPAERRMLQADYAAHHSITRDDMLAVFKQVERDYVVSANELSGLRTLVSHASIVAMPDYVANLTNKVVNGDPANAGLASAASPTGNLFDGCKSSQLSTLVGDWFQGFNPVTAASPSIKMTWTSGTLFGKGGPKYTDVAQGALGDCTLLASVAEVALRRPSTIQSMFIANSDGSETVRLYHNGRADYVTVNTMLPGGGQIYDRVQNGVLWVAMLEKAIVQENESGWLGTLAPGSKSYSAIDGGNAQTTEAYLSAMTGSSSSFYVGTNAASIASAWQSNKLVVLATGTPAAGSHLIANHAYALAALDTTSSTPYTLFNPWGIGFGQVAVNASTLSSSFEFTANAGSSLLANPVSTPDVHATPANAAIDQLFADWRHRHAAEV